jgi:capsular exopolysaccharide synthesis family protein
MQTDTKEEKVDFRLYIGILFFRWQIIVMCFLCSLLAGVIYINAAAKIYLTKCKIMIHRETNLEVSTPSSPLQSFATHQWLLQSDGLRKQVVRRLLPGYGRAMGGEGKMMLSVDVSMDRMIGSTLIISVKCVDPNYGQAFLVALTNLHETEWNKIQLSASEKVSDTLQAELYSLQDKIQAAENDLIEYERSHDIAKVDAKSSMESQYLSAIMGRKNQLSTELMMLEASHPALKDAGAGVISDVGRLTMETGAISPAPEKGEEGSTEGGSEDGGTSSRSQLRLPEIQRADKALSEGSPEETGWRDLRVKLAQLQQREKELAEKFKPEHPELMGVRKDIADAKNQLDLAAQVEMARLNDRHKALSIALNALESAENNWKAKNVLASQRRSELRRLSAVVDRFDDNYKTLYSRLHDMRISEELKAEHFREIEEVATDPTPVWPSPLKILLSVMAFGLGSGFGIAVLLQVLDNKVQTIKDVEQELGVPFLGGIPYWAESGLDTAVRPIVTEEDSIGAVEAYRALRTLLVTALDKENEKIIAFTSADAKEGKTLTALNFAIMLTQMHKKVLLLDMDLRRGRLHRSLGIEKEPGLSNVMKHSATLKSVIVHTRFEGLDFAPTGEAIHNSAELFQTSNVKRILKEVESEYDYVVIDTSPVLRVTDTVILSTQDIGVFVFVARVNQTPKPMIRYAINLMKNARIIGLIMNNIELHKISGIYYAYQYPNYAYYSNAYRYGSDYYDYGDGSGDGKRRRTRRDASWARRMRKVAQWARRTFLPME